MAKCTTCISYKDLVGAGNGISPRSIQSDPSGRALYYYNYFACNIIFGLLTIQRQRHLLTLTFKFSSASPAPAPYLSNFHFPCGDFSRAPPLLKIPLNTCNFMKSKMERAKRQFLFSPKLFDVVILYTAVLRCNSITLFCLLTYKTRSAANKSYYRPPARRNYAIFNIRFQGPKVRNSLVENVKSTSCRKYNENLKRELLSKY